MESSVGLHSEGLALQGGYDKDSDILLQNKVKNFILTPKENIELCKKRHMLKKGNLGQVKEKEQKRKMKFCNKENSTGKKKINMQQVLERNYDPKKQNMKDLYGSNKKNTMNTSKVRGM